MTVAGRVSVFRDTGAILAESPAWVDGRLAWVDITAGELHLSPADGPVDGSGDTVLRFPPPLSAVQPVAGGGWVLALGDRVILADGDGHETAELARIRHAHAGLRLNEGKCDPQGRFVVGSMNLTTGEPDGAFYRVGPDGAAVLLGGVAVGNGLEWSLDERTVYVTDTGAPAIYRASWDAASGPGELMPFVEGEPSDGLTIDADGCLWNGRYGDGCVVRLAPDGRELERVSVPAPNVTGVAFGGEDRSTLFVCTARENLTEQQLRDAPASGAVFAIETTTRGLPVREYRPA